MGCASITSTACSIPRPTCGGCSGVSAARRPGRHFYLVVEKILTPHERLRDDWPVDGTTGYDFLNQVLGAADRCRRRARLHQTATSNSPASSAASPRSRGCRKLHIMDNEMASELNVLARDMARLARQNPRTADFTRDLLRRAIKELIACFPVYRTYIDSSGELDERGPARPELGAGAGAAQRDRDRPERLRLSRTGADRRAAAAPAQRLLAPVAAALCDAAAAIQRAGGRQGPGGHRVLSL